jgi:hypothetical protein
MLLASVRHPQRVISSRPGGPCREISPADFASARVLVLGSIEISRHVSAQAHHRLEMTALFVSRNRFSAGWADSAGVAT